MKKGRTNYVIKNAWVGVLAEAIAVLLSFISRTLFIKILGNEYLGINGLFTNVLTLLSVAELGVGEAIIYHLYKPLALNDEKKIKVYINFYKKAYTTIGIIIMILGLCVIPFMDLIITKKPNIPDNLDLIYVLFLINTSLSYFYVYKTSILKANQQNYIIVIFKQVFHCVQLVVQIILLYLTHNYILYLIIQFLCTFLTNYFTSRKAAKMYPYINNNYEKELTKSEKDSIYKHIKGSFLYKIGSSILNGTDTIIITRYLGLGIVGIASNYNLIYTTIKKFLSQITAAFTASLGNLNATEKVEKEEKVMFQVVYICFVVYGYAAICLTLLSNDLINIWIGEKYMFGMFTVFLCCLNIYINGVRYATYAYRSTLGLFQYFKFIPIASAIINIISSIVLAKYMGVNGVYLGTIIAIGTTYFWSDPVIVYKKEFHKSPIKYFLVFFKYLFYALLIGAVTYFVTKGIIVTNFLRLVLKLIAVSVTVLVLMILFTFNSWEYKALMEIIKNKLKRRKSKEA